ncbi:hypothetical protein [Cohnella herbarum]|uniref:Uncharacterized protein n=1 Tax=Cohnella herbarum TaxID=2728023 RepID=A0A7Z2VPU1_9BACL|nr:hypothetical protein [Cohnella herbarum]QJD87009.1 hypothetical protein HH215_30100 [Cohnella herbarum]
MSMKYRFVLIAALAFVLLLFAGKWAINLLEPFRSFTVTVHNESGRPIVAVETGINTGSPNTSDVSKHDYEEVIDAGESVKIKPRLTVSGESSIYQKFTYENGETKDVVVCGYTEYASGYSKVTLRADGTVDVEQKCM